MSPIASGINRRQFIAGASASALALPRIAAGGEPARVAVIGAGLAGLSAAYLLSESNVDVTLFEASDRVGGRIFTLRDHFADDAWVDVGGQSVGGTYGNFIGFCNAFDLPFEAPPPRGPRPDVLLHLNDQMLTASALRKTPALWPIDLTPEEKRVAPFGLLSRYLDPVAREIGPVASVLSDRFSHYDAMNLRAFLVDAGASNAAIAMIDHTLNYNSVETVSALSALRDRARFLLASSEKPLVLEGGNQTLTDAFGQRLKRQLKLGHRVQSIQQADDAVTLVVKTGGGEHKQSFDRVIVAIPFTAMRKIQVTPGLPQSKQRAIDELPYTAIVQTYLQTRSRFWETDTPIAMVLSDGPLERLFNASSRLEGDRGLLVNWVNGTGIDKIAAASPTTQIDNVVREMQRLWPGCDQHIEKTFANDWTRSYVGGAYAHYAPGQMTAFAREIPRPVGRLHFAGEHTELVAPGMEGALMSGRRAAAEVVRRLA